MKIVFHSNQLSLRGTEVALFDYAYFNQTLLGNESIVVFDRNSPNNAPAALQKFQEHFPTIAYDRFEDVDALIREHNADLLYCIKSGKRDGKVSRIVPTMVHAVFPTPVTQVHGAAYAYVSDWLSLICSNSKVPAVPHMIYLPRLDKDVAPDLRAELGIPEEATVFAYYGGEKSFDIAFVKQEVIPEVLRRKPDVYFLFMNIEKFIDHPRALFLPGSSDVEYKVRFINTSDAMLHARQAGETFGIACGEFSIMNKPVFAYEKSRDKNHLLVLGDKAYIYADSASLKGELFGFDRKKAAQQNWDCYSAQYSPQRVMEMFDQHFIKEALHNGVTDIPSASFSPMEKLRSSLAVTGIKLRQRL